MSWILPGSAPLSEQEAAKLDLALRAAWTIPLIRDIEGYIWETIFHYVKGIPIPESSSKALFDAVDLSNGKGWSLKTLQWNIQNINIEFVIQRADIIKKAKELGFNEKLSEESDPNDLGRALVKHWNAKVVKDTQTQRIHEGYLVVLVKSEDRREYVFVQEPIPMFHPDELMWTWTVPREPKKKIVSKEEVLVEAITQQQHLGLQAKSKLSGKTVLKWYIGQKQLFQCLTIPHNAPRFTIIPRRAQIDSFFEAVVNLPNYQMRQATTQQSLFEDI